MTKDNEADKRNEMKPQIRNEEANAVPVYQKPVLRKYDQIEQVKPYGPSELETG
jgi:hypothetical protein